MKIAIIGADGQLGSDLCGVIPQSQQIPLTIKEIDITDFGRSEELLIKHSPDIIINTAAYHMVDDCEDNVSAAMTVNALGPRNLALICKKVQASLVHISTDYVFAGDKNTPYTEEDVPNPQTAYGISKLAGELFVKYILKNFYVIRTSGLYGAAGCLGKGRTNFVEGMIKRAKEGQKIKVVDDEIVGPTYTRDLAKKIYELVLAEAFGLYHVSNSGECSWWEFTAKIFEFLGIAVNVEKASGADYITKSRRPKYSVLKNRLGAMRPWPEALKDYLLEKGHL